MSKKKQQIILQETLETQSDFDNYICKDGLKVVDAYAEWCGPCTALIAAFKRIKTELSDPILSFATAKTDGISQLEKYRNKSIPQILFYGKDTLVNVIRGANTPEIESAIHRLLEDEHNAIENGAERVVFTDAELAEAATTTEEPNEAEDVVAESKKTYTVLLIKPSLASTEEAVDEIFAAVAEAGFKVAGQDDVELDEDKAKALLKDHEGADGFDDLVTACTSGPSKALLLSSNADGTTAVDAFLALLADPTEREADEEGEGADAQEDGDARAAEDEDKGEDKGEDKAENKGENTQKDGSDAASDEGKETADADAEAAGAEATTSVLRTKYAADLYSSTTDEAAHEHMALLFPDLATDLLHEGDAAVGDAPKDEGDEGTADGDDGTEDAAQANDGADAEQASEAPAGETTDDADNATEKAADGAEGADASETAVSDEATAAAE